MEVSTPVLMVVTSLLGHGSLKASQSWQQKARPPGVKYPYRRVRTITQVQAASARVLGIAAECAPASGATLLPSVLYHLKNTVERLCGGNIPKGTDTESARACLALLSSIPELATSQTSVGAVLAAVQPLTSSGQLECPDRRVTCSGWRCVDSSYCLPVVRCKGRAPISCAVSQCGCCWRHGKSLARPGRPSVAFCCHRRKGSAT